MISKLVIPKSRVQIIKVYLTFGTYITFWKRPIFLHSCATCSKLPSNILYVQEVVTHFI